MSIVSSILEQSADVLAAGHNDQLTLLPADVTVGGYAQDLAADPLGKGSAPRLRIGEEGITHIIWVLRNELTDVILSDVNEIKQEGASKTYRVHRAQDDPNVPDVAFYCTLA